MYVESLKKWMKNHGLSKNVQFCIIWKEEATLIQQMYSSFKERPCFLPSYLINFLFSSQKIYLGSYPKSPATCFSSNLRNMIEYKDRCQVIIFFFWTFPQLGYYLVAGGERMCQHGTVACGQVTLPLSGEQLLDNESDIRSIISDTRVFKVVQYVLSQ